MTKRELVMMVASKLGLTQNEVSGVVQAMLDTVTEVLADGKRVEIRNFGVFEVRTRDARMGRNPRTGEEVPIARKRIAAFKPGKFLKEWVQEGSGTSPKPGGPGESQTPPQWVTSRGKPPEPSPAPDAAEETRDRPGEQQTLF